jgi:two-component system, LuxR family, response regulator FixJ
MGRRIDQARDVVYIIEDDDAARALFFQVARSMGLGCEAFASATEFLARCDALRPGCLVLDLVMPDVGGLALQQELILRGITIPVIFVTGNGQIATAVEAMRQGAFNFLEKPFSNSELIENIRRAIDLDHSHRRMLGRLDAIREKLDSLTPREHDVLNQVVSGRPNKIIAHDLNLSQRSIEMHRSRVMEKMGASSVAQLVRMLISVESSSREGQAPPEGGAPE